MNKPIAKELATSIARALDDPGHDVWPSIAALAYDHPAVLRAVIAINAAKRAATLAVTRDLEGLVAAEVQRVEAERVVGWLTALLVLVQQHERLAAVLGPAPTDGPVLLGVALGTAVWRAPNGNVGFANPNTPVEQIAEGCRQFGAQWGYESTHPYAVEYLERLVTKRTQVSR